jgi:hypothetical protein
MTHRNTIKHSSNHISKEEHRFKKELAYVNKLNIPSYHTLTMAAALFQASAHPKLGTLRMAPLI